MTRRSTSKYAVAYQSPPIGFSAVLAQNRTEIVSRDQPIWAVSVRRIVGAMVVQLHIGPNGDPITVRQGNRIRFQQYPTLAGLFLSTGAGGAGALVELVTVQDANGGDEGGPAFEVIET